MKKYNTLITLLLVAVMVLGAFVSGYAVTAEQKQKEAESAEQKAEEAGEKADAAKDKAADLEVKFYELQSEIEEQQAKIEKTKVKIEKKQQQIEKQTDALNDRLTAMYKTGSIGFIDVVLNSEGIEDLLSNMGMVQKILKSDQNLLRRLEDDLKEIEELKQQQESQEATLKDKQSEIETTRKEYIAAAKKYEQDEEQLRSQAEKLAAEAQKLAEEAEKDKSFKPTPTGQYAWPTDSNYIFTSYYGWRIHPIFGTRKYHSGYDICLTNGSYGKPVYSAGDGVVTMASYNGGYGNCVMVAIGNGYTTLYGHLSSYAVSYGQKVKKGQVVGYIGSTGWSTGPHLHFSLLKNGTLVDPMILY